MWELCTVLFLLPAFSFAATSDYLLDDVVGGKLPALSDTQMLDALAQGKLISIGESHEVGLEREVIGWVYAGLAGRLAVKPDACLVENYPLLVERLPAQDPMKLHFFEVCLPGVSVNNDGAYYQELLESKLDLKGPAPLVTHTGFRHILPWGLLYSGDFPTHPLDQQEQGTLTLQLPKDFVKKGFANKSYAQNGFTMRSHATLDLDNLVVQELRNELKKGTSTEKIGGIISRQLSVLEGGPQRRNFEVKAVQKKYPWHQAFFTLLDHRVLKLSQVLKLLASPELGIFLKETGREGYLVGYSRGDRPGEFLIGDHVITEPGYLYLVGNRKSKKDSGLLLGIYPDGKLELSEFKEPSSTPAP